MGTVDTETHLGQQSGFLTTVCHFYYSTFLLQYISTTVYNPNRYLVVPLLHLRLAVLLPAIHHCSSSNPSYSTHQDTTTRVWTVPRVHSERETKQSFPY